MEKREKKSAIQLFEDRQMRTAWDEESEEWYFSIIDVIAILTESMDPSAYWRKLKQRLKAEGNETVTNCHSLKMIAADGKKTSYRCGRYRAALTYHSIRAFT